MRSMDTTSNHTGARWLALLRPFPDQSTTGDAPTLAVVIERIRRRWKLRLLLDGLLWTLLLSLVTVFASAWLVNAWHFEPSALWTLRVITLFSIVLLTCRVGVHD